MILLRPHKSAVSRVAAVVVVVIILVVGVGAYLTLGMGGGSSTTSSTSSTTSKPSVSSSTAVPSSSTSASLQKISIGTGQAFISNYFLPMLIGQQSGIFQKDGLDVSWIPYQSTAVMHQDIVTGKTTMALDSLLDIIQKRASGLAIRCVGIYWPGPTQFTIFVAPNSTITTPKQLNNTNVGILSLGDISDFYMKLFAQHFNLTLKLVAAGSFPSEVGLLKTGRVSAFDTNYQNAVPLILQGSVKPIYNIADAEPSNWPDGNCIEAPDNLIQQNPALVSKVVHAILDVSKYMQDNPQVVGQVYMKQTNSTQAAADKVVSAYKWSPGGSINTAGIPSFESALVKFGLITGTAPPPTDVYDTRFVQSGS